MFGLGATTPPRPTFANRAAGARLIFVNTPLWSPIPMMPERRIVRAHVQSALFFFETREGRLFLAPWRWTSESTAAYFRSPRRRLEPREKSSCSGRMVGERDRWRRKNSVVNIDRKSNIVLADDAIYVDFYVRART